MKKLLLLSIVSIFLLPSCGTVLIGMKRTIFFVDAPKDLVVTNGNENLEVKQININKSDKNYTVGSKSYIYIHCTGVSTKIKWRNNFVLQSGGQSIPLKIKARPQIGLLIGETIFTLGIFTVVDLISGAYKMPKPRFVDVPAVFEKKKPRTQENLYKKIETDFRHEVTGN